RGCHPFDGTELPGARDLLLAALDVCRDVSCRNRQPPPDAADLGRTCDPAPERALCVSRVVRQRGARMTGAARGGFFSDVDASGQADAAEQYLRAAADRAAELRRAGYELLGVAEGWSVLDVGCGLGEVCADLTGLVGPNGRVVGIDVSTALIARARERWSQSAVEFDVGDAEALAFEDECFDAVRAERVVQHLSN